MLLYCNIMGKKNKCPINKTLETTPKTHAVDTTNNGTCTVQFGCPMVLVPSTHEKTYNDLIQENKLLHEQLSILTGERNQLKELLGEKDRNIEELREENAKLRKKIESLENKVVELNGEIIELKSEIIILQQERYKNKIIVAMQDINGIELLENKIDVSFRKELIDLHSDRLMNCHYIFNKSPKIDSPETMNYKKRMLLAMFENPKLKEIIDDIDDDYNIGFVDAYKKILQIVINPTIKDPTDNDKKKIMKYWK